MESKKSATLEISVPYVTGEAADKATDVVEQLAKKYNIADLDMDAMFNALLTIYFRNRAVYGDRQPSFCAFAQPRDPSSKPNN